VDNNESSLGTEGEDRQEGHPEKLQPGEVPSAAPVTPVTPPAPSAGANRREEVEDSAEPIMARLPRSRPKREKPRRKTARPRPAGTKAPRGGTGAKPKARPKTTASTRARGEAGASSAAQRTRTRTAASRKPAIGVRTRQSSADPEVLEAAEDAPGLPRLALDGAIEAAKLPVKIGANITFRALDAVTKGLRRR
jgi:hypothetical protein